MFEQTDDSKVFLYEDGELIMEFQPSIITGKKEISMNRKRYWLFAWDTFYPSGGLSQVKFKFDSIDEFKEQFNDFCQYQGCIIEHYVELLDLDTGGTWKYITMENNKACLKFVEFTLEHT